VVSRPSGLALRPLGHLQVKLLSANTPSAELHVYNGIAVLLDLVDERPRGARDVLPRAGRDESSWRGSRDWAGRSGIAGWETADFEQLQAEGFELVDDAVQGGLVEERAGEQRVVSVSAHGQRREGLHHRRADRPADAELVAAGLATAGRCIGGWHAIRVGVRGVSAHRPGRVNFGV